MPYALSDTRLLKKSPPSPDEPRTLSSFPFLLLFVPFHESTVLFLFSFFSLSFHFFSFFFHFFFPFDSAFFLLSFLSSSFSLFPFLSSFSHSWLFPFHFFSLSSLPFPTQKHYSSHMHVLEDSLACPNLTSIITEKKRCWEPCGCPDLTTCIEP